MPSLTRNAYSNGQQNDIDAPAFDGFHENVVPKCRTRGKW